MPGWPVVPLAGVTVAAYLVPQVMAYATIAGLPPVTGLWAAVPAFIAYVLFGSSRSLSMRGDDRADDPRGHQAAGRRRSRPDYARNSPTRWPCSPR